MEITLLRCDMPHQAQPLDIATHREFSIDGHDYEIDLCALHDQPFMDMIDKWAQAARAGSRTRPARPGRTAAKRQRSRAIRAWALATGKHLEAGGRLPVSVIRDYEQAHGA